MDTKRIERILLIIALLLLVLIITNFHPFTFKTAADDMVIYRFNSFTGGITAYHMHEGVVVPNPEKWNKDTPFIIRTVPIFSLIDKKSGECIL